MAAKVIRVYVVKLPPLSHAARFVRSKQVGNINGISDTSRSPKTMDGMTSGPGGMNKQ